ncbi:MAG: DUF2971 domain-containing protein [Clostridia bacterium]
MNKDIIWKSEEEKKEIELYNGILYHYTAVEGLLGIINSNNIWASSFPFLNDSSEIVYGRRLARSILIKNIDIAKDEISKKIYEECLALNGVEKKRIYITCFCEKGNLLSQWRGYGKSGLGFSVGLDSNKLNRVFRKPPYNEIHIKKVIYNLNTQTRIINKYLEDAIIYAKEKNIVDEKELKKIARLTDWEIDQNTAYFKDAAFEEEREWRAIYCDEKNPHTTIETKYRARSNRIVDYKEFNFSPNNLDIPFNNKLPLAEIICGPGVDHESTKEVIKNLLMDREYDVKNIKIEHSSIPFKII